MLKGLGFRGFKGEWGSEYTYYYGGICGAECCTRLTQATRNCVKFRGICRTGKRLGFPVLCQVWGWGPKFIKKKNGLKT